MIQTVFADKNEGKVLIMDNPFAQTNASHLLIPLMDMAKKEQHTAYLPYRSGRRVHL